MKWSLFLFIILVQLVPVMVHAQLVSENFTVEGASFNGNNTSLSGTSTNYIAEFEAGNLYIIPESTSTPTLSITTTGTRVNFPIIDTNVLFTPTLSGPDFAPVKSLVTFTIQVVRSDGEPLDPSTMQVAVIVTGANPGQPVVRYRGDGKYEVTYLVVNSGKDILIATVNGVTVTQEVEGIGTRVIPVKSENVEVVPVVPIGGLSVPVAPNRLEESPRLTPSRPSEIQPGAESALSPAFDNSQKTEIGDSLLTSVNQFRPLLILFSTVGAVTGLITIALSFARIPFSYTEISTLLSYGTRHVFGLITWQKRRRPWGVVYDSVTKVPLDPAYVQLFTVKNKVAQESITDLDGRYGFLVPEGRYTLKVNKTNYIFPSMHRPLLGQDVLYSNLYYGEELVVSDTVVCDIPLDPVGRDWNQEEKMRTKQTHFFRPLDVFIIIILDTLFYIGLVALSLQFYFVQTTITGVLLALYIVLLYLRIKGRKPILYGVLTLNNAPLAFAIIRILKKGYEVAHKVSDEHGRYAVLVAPGNYTVCIEERLSQDTYRTVYEHEVSAASGIINKSLKI